MTFAQFLSIIRARYRLALIVFLPLVLTVLVASLFWPKTFTATASVVLDTARPDPVAAALYSGGFNPSFVATQIDVIQSDRVATRVVRNLKLTENAELRDQWARTERGDGTMEQWLSGVFKRNLDVKPSRESTVVTVSYSAADPRFAAAMANAFVQAYLDTNLELKTEPAKQYSSFFEQRAREAREVLEKAQSQLSDFQRRQGIIASDERLDVENSRLAELSAQVVGLQALASDSGSRQSAARQGAERMQEVLSNPLVSGLKADQVRLESRLQELTSRLGDSNPQVLEARASLAELRLKIDAEISKLSSSLGIANNINQQRYGEVKAAFEAQRSKILQMKAVRDEGAVLQRDVESAQRTYEQLTQRLNQTTLESLANQSNVSVLSQAPIPTQPASPRVTLNVLVAVFLGALLSIGVVIGREMADRRIRSADDVVQATQVPLIGVLPAVPSRRLLGRARPSMSMQQLLLGKAASANNKAFK